MSCETVRERSRRRAGERVVLLLGIGAAVSLLGDSTLYTALARVDNAAEAAVTLAMVGILLAANRVIRLLTNGLAGVHLDRLPRSRLLVASLFAGKSAPAAPPVTALPQGLGVPAGRV